MVAALAALLSGCYYGHVAHGQFDLIKRRTPIEKILADPATDAELRRRLERAVDARRFASRELGLPDNGSYTTYVDVGRPYAVWNVFATPELSLRAHEWCYPLFGCLSYRGYYSRDRADREAAALREQGLDVFVAGVPAYSTLGWFDDPLLSTMPKGEDQMAGTIFHELAHQIAFAEDDTAFNESFATFVEHEGLRRYLKDNPELAKAVERRQRWESDYRRLMFAGRKRLLDTYVSDLPEAEKRARKQAVFARLRKDYVKLRRAWRGDLADDTWLTEPSNAQLLPFGLYQAWVPAFAVLFAQQKEDWPAFYAEVARLAALAPAERKRTLEALAPQLSPPDPPEEDDEETGEEGDGQPEGDETPAETPDTLAAEG